jgi:hypothetical protein
MENIKRNQNSHLTAIERTSLSYPARILLNQKKIKGKVLDFGCGIGKDVELLKNKVVLFIPDDLSIMAQKIGFIKVASNIPANFRDKVVLKNILVSNYKIIPELKKMMNDFGIPLSNL